jgi:hypothetical protein
MRGRVVVSETVGALVRDALPPDASLRSEGTPAQGSGPPGTDFQLCGSSLQTESPPLKPLGNPALLNNLPTQLYVEQ